MLRNTGPRDIFSLMFGIPFDDTPQIGQVQFKTPRFDLYEEKDNLVVRVELPGFTQDDVQISLEGNTLRITARKKKEEEAKGRRYFVQQIVHTAFSKEIELPYEVDKEHADAYFEDGYLIIKLPRVKEKARLGNIIKIRKK